MFVFRDYVCTESSVPCTRGSRLHKGFFVNCIGLCQGNKSLLLPYLVNAVLDTIWFLRVMFN